MYAIEAENSRNSMNLTPLRAVAVCVAIVGAFALPDLAHGAVPNPIVTGPIPALAAPGDPSHNYPFFSTSVDLTKSGCVEEEFFIEGTANRYNLPPLATGSIIDSCAPQKTLSLGEVIDSGRTFVVRC
jgi:Alpha/beta hydrolase domain